MSYGGLQGEFSQEKHESYLDEGSAFALNGSLTIQIPSSCRLWRGVDLEKLNEVCEPLYGVVVVLRARYEAKFEIDVMGGWHRGGGCIKIDGFSSGGVGAIQNGLG